MASFRTEEHAIASAKTTKRPPLVPCVTPPLTSSSSKHCVLAGANILWTSLMKHSRGDWLSFETFYFISDESCLFLRSMSCYSRPLGPLRYSKTCSKKHATCFATLLQSELNTNSNNAHYITHVRICIAKIRSQGFFVDGKTHNIAFQLVSQQCCKQVAGFFVVRFTIPLTSCAPLSIQRHFSQND